MSQRIAVTGLGVVAPGAIGTRNFWSLLAEGRTATRRITLFDPSPFRSQVAAEIDLDPAAMGFSPRELRRMDRVAQLCVVAAREAVAASGVDFANADPYRVAVVIGSAVGATMSLDSEYRIVSDDGKTWLVDHDYGSPRLYEQLVPSSIAAEVAWLVDAQGPVTVVSTGCTSGIDAVAYGAELIREGSADVVVAGASDAPLSPITLACFDAIKATTPRNDTPETASRPFDGTRNGFVLGEGAAVMVLENREHARRRGAPIHAEIAGFASRANAYHMTGLRKDGYEMANAITTALDEAKVAPTGVDYINAHGSGTKQNDRHETAAFKKSLGPTAYEVPVSSIKSMIGHSLGAIGSLEIVASILAMENDVVPPTANLWHPDPECDLDYVPRTAREHRTDVVLTVGSGFGGFQSAMVLTTGRNGER
ncbi:beta-ketoacyl-[acyl-carrier-protein] synthase family protein [Saccharopolyspora phatthalungensis]|uniref:Act minimal PKS ketosynthase (KS/KS alpha) n=1 Tax=Saccharopolyspora phatthalungensis TaxID=664693 RepID=A0A840QEE5_9PSEU|nr:beta-ketoacyl-[acyl-carrier-protein] synthase family protein [Saccharopolyspora phatthalungensis]MBB5156855.1 act minimal PKS ketosynthase (KS/KS alpha) [Saccharopolyspora phatthalungensis]